MRMAIFACVLLLACEDQTRLTYDGTGGAGHAPPGIGTDDPASLQCLACHEETEGSWTKPSSHRLLYDCTICHEQENGAAGPGHRSIPACSNCHSESAHPATWECARCHDPHGSDNRFLIRTLLELPDGGSTAVHFTAPEGASADGLVHTGPKGGGGVCQVCHSQTNHSGTDGGGAPHPESWCPSCHSHQSGFSPPE